MVTRADYYQVLADTLTPETLVVTALGNASYLWAAMRDAPQNFYLEDAMGLALPLALGLAVARPDRSVVVIEGDGGLLMHMGGLVTVGAMAPKNLTILLIQNGVHAASGGQALTNASLDFAAIARDVGIPNAETISSVQALRPAITTGVSTDGPALLALETEPDLQIALPPRGFDPLDSKRRLMQSIDAPRYVPTFFGGGMIEER